MEFTTLPSALIAQSRGKRFDYLIGEEAKTFALRLMRAPMINVVNVVPRIPWGWGRR